MQTPTELPDENSTSQSYPKVVVGTLPGISTMHYCTSACSMNPDCLLACLENNQCILYKAIISKHYDPKSYTGFKITKTCYSRWFFKNDLTHLIHDISSSSVHENIYFASQFADGFYIEGLWNHYHSRHMATDPWALIELKESKKIQSIVIKTRDHNHGTAFHDIYISVGNDKNALKPFGQYGVNQSPASRGSIVEIKGKPTKAKFIKIVKTPGQSIVIGELAILGA